MVLRSPHVEEARGAVSKYDSSVLWNLLRDAISIEMAPQDEG
jgi:hypothetical protein